MYDFRRTLQQQGHKIAPALLCDALKTNFLIAIEPGNLRACYRDAKRRIEKRGNDLSVSQAMEVGLRAFGKATVNGS